MRDFHALSDAPCRAVSRKCLSRWIARETRAEGRRTAKGRPDPGPPLSDFTRFRLRAARHAIGNTGPGLRVADDRVRRGHTGADRQAADLAPAINEKAADNRDDLPPGLTYEAKIEGGPEALRRFLRWKGGRLCHPSCSDVIVSINGEDVRNCTVWQACVRPRPRASGSD